MNYYFYARWKDAPIGMPTEFYSELDSNRYEIRKIEIFRNRKVGVATTKEHRGTTELGTIPVPSIEEINLQDEFSAEEISQLDFEKAWADFVGHE